MNQWNHNARDEDRKDKPPYSRVFVVCGKDTSEADLRPVFEQFGTIEYFYMPINRDTGESKGVAYVKYHKTSEAAAAIQDLHLKTVGSKTLKVMVAVNKTDKFDQSKDEHNRLFIKVSKQATESDIRQYFEQFGQIERVYLQKDRFTNESRGLAYVHFSRFLEAAKAFEECDKKYKPVFAEPKQDLKRGRDNMDVLHDNFHSSSSSFGRDIYNDGFQTRGDFMQKDVNTLMPVSSQRYTVFVTCSPEVPQKYIEKLFNIIPGMLQCKYSVDAYNGFCKAMITYTDEKSATCAVERLNNFEFPSGEIICVKPDNLLSQAATQLSTMVNSFKNAVDKGSPDLLQLADAIAQASTLIKAATTGVDQSKDVHDQNYCNVVLPPPQLMANSTSKVAQRCFVICKPQPPPITVLKDVFRRFGDLIDITIVPNKTFGFARYASARAAQNAIKTLHEAVVCGIKLKVLEAEEKPQKDNDNRMNTDTDDDCDRKRQRLIDDISD